MLSVEFLDANGFSPVRFPDGLFYLRHYSAYEHYIQVSEDLSDISEAFDGHIERLTEAEAVATIERHNKAINQYCK